MKPTATFERPMFGQKTVILVITLCLLQFGCNNNKNANTGKSADSTTQIVTTKDALVGPVAAGIQLHKYRLGWDTVITHIQYNNYEKLIFNIEMDLATPADIDLRYYEAQKLASGGRIGLFKYQAKTLKDVVTLNPAIATIGNTELVFDDWYDRPTQTWRVRFDYLLLTPVVDNGNLAFEVHAFTNGAGEQPDQEVALPASGRLAKPSPPAKPAKVNIENHTVGEVKVTDNH